MFQQHSTVRTTKALPEHGLAAGAFGCVLEVSGDGEAYLVEFCNSNGETRALLALLGADLELVPQTPPRPEPLI